MEKINRMIQEEQLISEEEPSVPISEMFEFAKWIDHSTYTNVGEGWTNGISRQSNEQLYQQFKATTTSTQH